MQSLRDNVGMVLLQATRPLDAPPLSLLLAVQAGGLDRGTQQVNFGSVRVYLCGCFGTDGCSDSEGGTPLAISSGGRQEART